MLTAKNASSQDSAPDTMPGLAAKPLLGYHRHVPLDLSAKNKLFLPYYVALVMACGTIEKYRIQMGT